VMQRQISGKLSIREVDPSGAAWQVHAGNGQLHFASSEVGEQERLAYILCRTKSPLVPLLQEEPFTSAYQFLCHSWRTGRLDLNQLRTLVRLISQEALIHIMSLPQAVVQFDRAIDLESILVSLDLRELVMPIARQIGAWQQLRPHINSPLQRVYITNGSRFDSELALPLSTLGTSKDTESIGALLLQRPCLYELATALDCDLLQLATLLAKSVESGVLAVSSFANVARAVPQATIACIDDSATVQRNVKLILEAANYNVLGLTDPLQALSRLVKERPALILMDISMPNLDGYELSRLLRQSSVLRHTPIVMLTGRDGFVDKVRARVVGATDYITKPFEAKVLMDAIQKHLKLEVISQ
jgi:twitching motility two-component system response regulator PilG